MVSTRSWSRFSLGSVEVAQIDDGLRRPLGRDEGVAGIGGSPNVRERHEPVGQRVLPDQQPVGMLVLAAGKPAIAERLEGLLHRIEGIPLARQHPELDELVKRLRERRRGVGRDVEEALVREQLSHRHLVQRQRARLVDAQHGGRPERLERRHAPGQHALLRDAPGAECQEDRQDRRKLVGQDGHRERKPGEEAAEPVRTKDAVGDHDQRAEAGADHGEAPHQRGGLSLERAALRDDRV